MLIPSYLVSEDATFLKRPYSPRQKLLRISSQTFFKRWYGLRSEKESTSRLYLWVKHTYVCMYSIHDKRDLWHFPPFLFGVEPSCACLCCSAGLGTQGSVDRKWKPIPRISFQLLETCESTEHSETGLMKDEEHLLKLDELQSTSEWLQSMASLVKCWPWVWWSWWNKLL